MRNRRENETGLPRIRALKKGRQPFKSNCKARLSVFVSFIFFRQVAFNQIEAKRAKGTTANCKKLYLL